MTRLIFLGAAGSGKTTQAHLLSEILKMPAISSGEMLRSAIGFGLELGDEVRRYVESGELVPDELMISLLRTILTHPNFERCWAIEGYPRTAFQAEELDFLLEELNQPLDLAIYLKVSEDILMQRSLARGDYDDTTELIHKRLQLFQERTTPILDYYEHKQKLVTIDGSLDPASITAQIQQKLAG
ncbi:nucleoside monophosphate kinase [Tumidithrix elongata RA019]|uniref:Adenylate kinase n=1 Tax=Tumidithrix elongata BACA0141 TaxID=2716417 RepID=A0AAW9Q7E9_9CYAN|nr:nucleoside monophosphate kinase [Tumidithrix elongata RA019]